MRIIYLKIYIFLPILHAFYINLIILSGPIRFRNGSYFRTTRWFCPKTILHNKPCPENNEQNKK